MKKGESVFAISSSSSLTTTKELVDPISRTTINDDEYDDNYHDNENIRYNGIMATATATATTMNSQRETNGTTRLQQQNKHQYNWIVLFRGPIVLISISILYGIRTNGTLDDTCSCIIKLVQSYTNTNTIYYIIRIIVSISISCSMIVLFCYDVYMYCKHLMIKKCSTLSIDDILYSMYNSANNVLVSMFITMSIPTTVYTLVPNNNNVSSKERSDILYSLYYHYFTDSSSSTTSSTTGSTSIISNITFRKIFTQQGYWIQYITNNSNPNSDLDTDIDVTAVTDEDDNNYKIYSSIRSTSTDQSRTGSSMSSTSTSSSNCEDNEIINLDSTPTCPLNIIDDDIYSINTNKIDNTTTGTTSIRKLKQQQKLFLDCSRKTTTIPMLLHVPPTVPKEPHDIIISYIRTIIQERIQYIIQQFIVQVQNSTQQRKQIQTTATVLGTISSIALLTQLRYSTVARTNLYSLLHTITSSTCISTITVSSITLLLLQYIQSNYQFDNDDNNNDNTSTNNRIINNVHPSNDSNNNNATSRTRTAFKGQQQQRNRNIQHVLNEGDNNKSWITLLLKKVLSTNSDMKTNTDNNNSSTTDNNTMIGLVRKLIVSSTSWKGLIASIVFFWFGRKFHQRRRLYHQQLHRNHHQRTRRRQ